MSPNAVAKALSLWLGCDYFSCRGLIPARSACFDVHAAGNRQWSFMTKGGALSFESVGAMAEAMKHAVRAGRLAFIAGRIPRKMYATASSPIEGMVGR
jgi:hypothetical protein